MGPLLGFTGQPRDPLTGCYHLGNGHRTYNPVLMRFHSSDSLSPFAEGGPNAYAYCAGDPVNRHDPTGHFFEAAGLTLRALGMASNAATLVYNFLGPVPTSRVGLNAHRISTAGSLLSLISSAFQFAGVQSAVFGSNVGTAISMLATAARAIHAAVGPGAKPLQQIRNNWNSITAGAPPAAVEIPLDTVTSLQVRPSIIRRPTREIRALQQPARLDGQDPWAFHRSTVGIRKRNPSV